MAMYKLSVTSVNTNIVFKCLYISSWFCKNNYHYDITKVSLVLCMMEHCRLCSQNFAAWKIFLKVAYLENVNLYGLFCKGQRGQKGTHIYAKFLLLRSTSKKKLHNKWMTRCTDIEITKPNPVVFFIQIICVFYASILHIVSWKYIG